MQSKTTVEYLEICRLPQNKSPFVFRVQAVDAIGDGIPSESSDPICLLQPPPNEMSAGDLPSKPGKPQAIKATHSSIYLEWTKPEKGAEIVTSYTILYRSQFSDPPNQWRELETANPEEKVVVSQLIENATYLFQIQPVCEVGVGSESDVSDPITTRISSKPGKPRALEITYNSITLEWSKPELAAHNVTSYSVFCRSKTDPVDHWTYIAMATGERSVISQLEENTTYYFKIQLQYDDEDGLQSDVSDPISTTDTCVSFVCVFSHYLATLLAIGPPPKYLWNIRSIIIL